MNTLKEIIAALDRYKVRHVDVLTNAKTAGDDKTNRYFDMYAGIRDNRWQSESEMAAHFGMHPDSKRFTRLKNEVKKRLLNSILFIDTSLPEFSDYRRGYALAAQQWAVIRTLHHIISTDSLLDLSDRTLKLAEHYEIFDIALDIARHMKSYLAHVPGGQRKYELMQEKADFFKRMYAEELQANAACERLYLEMLGKKWYNRETALLAQELLATLEPFAAENQSVVFQAQYSLLQIHILVLQQRWQDALLTARHAKQFLTNKPFLHSINLLAILNREASCLIMLNCYAEAEDILVEATTLATEGTRQWFKIQELRLVNAMYAASYRQAWQHLRNMQKHPSFPLQNALDQENWRLYQGYLCLLARSGQLSLSPRDKVVAENFRLSSWVNSLPHFSQDKRGANIPILLFQALYLLHEGRLEAFDNRIEALRKYRQRNLDPQNGHFRADCFIRLLENVSRQGCQPGAVEKSAGPLLEKLRSVSGNVLDHNFEIEIVPYERQWEWITGMLRR